MNILITGGTGYLGARISLSLSKNNKIFIQSRKKKNSKLNYKNIIQFKYNWKDHSILDKYLKNIDVIIHTAGTDSKFCENYKKQAQECYVNNTDILYYYAMKNNISKIFNFSTTQVYGSKKGQIHEDCSVDLYNNYAFLNYEREILSKKYKKNKIKITNLRLSNCFGFPVLKNTNCWHLIFPNICKNIVTHNKIGLKTNKDMYKNFTTIFDLSQLLRHLINSKAYYPSLINFSSGKPKKISQIIKMIINISKNSGNQNLLNNLHSLEKVSKPNRNIVSNYLDEINFKFMNNYSYEIKNLLNVTKKFFQ